VNILAVCVHIIASVSQQIPRLSRTFSLNFQDFPGPKSFPRTIQVLEILQKNPGLSGRCGNPVFQSTGTHEMVMAVNTGLNSLYAKPVLK